MSNVLEFTQGLQTRVTSIVDDAFDFIVLQAEHLPTLVEIEHRSHKYPWREANFLSSMQSHLCVGMRHNGVLVAYCVMSFVAMEAEILLFVVDKKRQGKGLGRHFLRCLIDALSQPGLAFFLEVGEDNGVAIKLYESIGFNQVGERKAYYRGQNGETENALVYAYQAM